MGIIKFPDNGRNTLHTELFDSTEPAFTGNDLKNTIADPNYYGLNHPVGLDGLAELIDPFFIKNGPRLKRTRHNLVQRKLLDFIAGGLFHQSE
ncbi:hypothetical protein D3C71_1754850 [compost metagenome]